MSARTEFRAWIRRPLDPQLTRKAHSVATTGMEQEKVKNVSVSLKKVSIPEKFKCQIKSEMETTKTETPFTCDICGVKIKYSRNLTTHRKKKHADILSTEVPKKHKRTMSPAAATTKERGRKSKSLSPSRKEDKNSPVLGTSKIFTGEVLKSSLIDAPKKDRKSRSESPAKKVPKVKNELLQSREMKKSKSPNRKQNPDKMSHLEKKKKCRSPSPRKTSEENKTKSVEIIYSQSSVIESNSDSAVPVKVFECNICGKKYTLKYSLVRHFKKKHGEVPSYKSPKTEDSLEQSLSRCEKSKSPTFGSLTDSECTDNVEVKSRKKRMRKKLSNLLPKNKYLSKKTHEQSSNSSVNYLDLETYRIQKSPLASDKIVKEVMNNSMTSGSIELLGASSPKKMTQKFNLAVRLTYDKMSEKVQRQVITKKAITSFDSQSVMTVSMNMSSNDEPSQLEKTQGPRQSSTIVYDNDKVAAVTVGVDGESSEVERSSSEDLVVDVPSYLRNSPSKLSPFIKLTKVDSFEPSSSTKPTYNKYARSTGQVDHRPVTQLHLLYLNQKQTVSKDQVESRPRTPLPSIGLKQTVSAKKVRFFENDTLSKDLSINKNSDPSLELPISKNNDPIPELQLDKNKEHKPELSMNKNSKQMSELPEVKNNDPTPELHIDNNYDPTQELSINGSLKLKENKQCSIESASESSSENEINPEMFPEKELESVFQNSSSPEENKLSCSPVALEQNEYFKRNQKNVFKRRVGVCRSNQGKISRIKKSASKILKENVKRKVKARRAKETEKLDTRLPSTTTFSSVDSRASLIEKLAEKQMTLIQKTEEIKSAITDIPDDCKVEVQSPRQKRAKSRKISDTVEEIVNITPPKNIKDSIHFPRESLPKKNNMEPGAKMVVKLDLHTKKSVKKLGNLNVQNNKDLTTTSAEFDGMKLDLINDAENPQPVEKDSDKVILQSVESSSEVIDGITSVKDENSRSQTLKRKRQRSSLLKTDNCEEKSERMNSPESERQQILRSEDEKTPSPKRKKINTSPTKHDNSVENKESVEKTNSFERTNLLCSNEEKSRSPGRKKKCVQSLINDKSEKEIIGTDKTTTTKEKECKTSKVRRLRKQLPTKDDSDKQRSTKKIDLPDCSSVNKEKEKQQNESERQTTDRQDSPDCSSDRKGEKLQQILDDSVAVALPSKTSKRVKPRVRSPKIDYSKEHTPAEKVISTDNSKTVDKMIEQVSKEESNVVEQRSRSRRRKKEGKSQSKDKISENFPIINRCFTKPLPGFCDMPKVQEDVHENVNDKSLRNYEGQRVSFIQEDGESTTREDNKVVHQEAPKKQTPTQSPVKSNIPNTKPVLQLKKLEKEIDGKYLKLLWDKFYDTQMNVKSNENNSKNFAEKDTPTDCTESLSVKEKIISVGNDSHVKEDTSLDANNSSNSDLLSDLNHDNSSQENLSVVEKHAEIDGKERSICSKEGVTCTVADVKCAKSISNIEKTSSQENDFDFRQEVITDSSNSSLAKHFQEKEIKNAQELIACKSSEETTSKKECNTPVKQWENNESRSPILDKYKLNLLRESVTNKRKLAKLQKKQQIRGSKHKQNVKKKRSVVLNSKLLKSIKARSQQTEFKPVTCIKADCVSKREITTTVEQVSEQDEGDIMEDIKAMINLCERTHSEIEVKDNKDPSSEAKDTKDNAEVKHNEGEMSSDLNVPYLVKNTHVCHKCDITFTLKSSLKRHNASCHSKGDTFNSFYIERPKSGENRSEVPVLPIPGVNNDVILKGERGEVKSVPYSIIKNEIRNVCGADIDVQLQLHKLKLSNIFELSGFEFIRVDKITWKMSPVEGSENKGKISNISIHSEVKCKKNLQRDDISGETDTGLKKKMKREGIDLLSEKNDDIHGKSKEDNEEKKNKEDIEKDVTTHAGSDNSLEDGKDDTIHAEKNNSLEGEGDKDVTMHTEKDNSVEEEVKEKDGAEKDMVVEKDDYRHEKQEQDDSKQDVPSQNIYSNNHQHSTKIKLKKHKKDTKHSQKHEHKSKKEKKSKHHKDDNPSTQPTLTDFEKAITQPKKQQKKQKSKLKRTLSSESQTNIQAHNDTSTYIEQSQEPKCLESEKLSTIPSSKLAQKIIRQKALEDEVMDNFTPNVTQSLPTFEEMMSQSNEKESTSRGVDESLPTAEPQQLDFIDNLSMSSSSSEFIPKSSYRTPVMKVARDKTERDEVLSAIFGSKSFKTSKSFKKAGLSESQRPEWKSPLEGITHVQKFRFGENQVMNEVRPYNVNMGLGLSTSPVSTSSMPESSGLKNLLLQDIYNNIMSSMDSSTSRREEPSTTSALIRTVKPDQYPIKKFNFSRSEEIMTPDSTTPDKDSDMCTSEVKSDQKLAETVSLKTTSLEQEGSECVPSQPDQSSQSYRVARQCVTNTEEDDKLLEINSAVCSEESVDAHDQMEFEEAEDEKMDTHEEIDEQVCDGVTESPANKNLSEEEEQEKCNRRLNDEDDHKMDTPEDVEDGESDGEIKEEEESSSSEEESTDDDEKKGKTKDGDVLDLYASESEASWLDEEEAEEKDQEEGECSIDENNSSVDIPHHASKLKEEFTEIGENKPKVATTSVKRDQVMEDADVYQNTPENFGVVDKNLIPKGFCYQYILNQTCSKPKCMYRHQIPSKEKIFQHGLNQISVCYNQSEKERAFSTYKKIKDLNVRDIPMKTILCLLRLAEEDHDVQLAFELFDTVDTIVNPEVISILISMCSSQAPLYAEKLWMLFQSLQSINMTPSSQHLTTLLRAFHEKQQWLRMWNMLNYCLHCPGYTVPIYVVRSAIKFVIEKPSNCIENAAHWLQNCQQDILYNIDNNQLESLAAVCLEYNYSALSDMIKAVAINLLPAAIEDKDVVDQVETASIKSDDTNADSEDPSTEENKSYLHRIQGVRFSKNWEYLAEVFVELCNTNKARCSKFTQIIVETLTFDKTKPKGLVDSFHSFFTFVNAVFIREKQEDVLAKLDRRALAIIGGEVLTVCMKREWWKEGLCVMQTLQSNNVNYLERLSFTGDLMSTVALETCLRCKEPYRALQLLEASKWSCVKSLNAMNKDFEKRLLQLCRLIEQFLERGQCRQSLKVLTMATQNALEAIHNANQDNQDVNFTAFKGLQDFFPKIIAGSIEAGDPYIGYGAFTLCTKSLTSTKLETSLLRQLLNACRLANYIDCAHEVYQHLHLSCTYPVQDIESLCIKLDSGMSLTESVILIKDYLIWLYKYLCDLCVQRESSIVPDKYLDLAIIVKDSLDGNQNCKQLLKMVMLSLERELTPKLKCFLRSLPNGEVVIKITSPSLFHYLTVVDRNSARQGFRRGHSSSKMLRGKHVKRD